LIIGNEHDSYFFSEPKGFIVIYLTKYSFTINIQNNKFFTLADQFY